MFRTFALAPGLSTERWAADRETLNGLMQRVSIGHDGGDLGRVIFSTIELTGIHAGAMAPAARLRKLADGLSDEYGLESPTWGRQVLTIDGQAHEGIACEMGDNYVAVALSAAAERGICLVANTLDAAHQLHEYANPEAALALS